jgi:hypothetical protein
MELRYSHVPRSVAIAVEAYRGALYTCGLIAQMWVFDTDRGTSNSSFKECSFYIDGGKTTYYCKSVRGSQITLTLFRSSTVFGSQMADMVVTSKESGLYLEVTDPAEDSKLRMQFIAHLRNPGRKVTPEEIGLRTVHGSEGSYTTAVIRVPVPKKPKHWLDRFGWPKSSSRN